VAHPASPALGKTKMLMKKVMGYAAIALAVLMSGCDRETPATSQTNQATVVKVAMHNMQFSPAAVDIKKGDVIEWTNDDITPHTATSPTFGDSGAIAPGKSWRHTFIQGGNLSYACTFHPTMKGVITVR
jgi:plastocyanin